MRLLTEHRRSAAARATAPVRRPGGGSPADRVLHLQRTAGNRAVTALVQRRGPHRLPEGAITSARLGELGTAEETAFRRRVYDAQQERALRTKRYFAGLTKGQLGSVDGQPIHKVAEPDARALVAAARADLKTEQANGDALALACTAVGVGNAYRDPERDLRAWTRAYNKYFKVTKKRREKLDDPFGDDAVAIVVKALVPKKAVPGFSNHTTGLAIDFSTVQGGVTLGPDAGQDELWAASWLYRWLGRRATEFRFTQLPSEKWHWDHAGGTPDAAGDVPSGRAGGSSVSTTSAAATAPVVPATAVAPTGGPARPAVTFGSRAVSGAVAASSLDILRDVLTAAGLTRATISSTARTATDQARAMYQNLVGRGRGQGVEAQLRLYGAAGDAVINVFVEQRANGNGPDAIKAAMRDKIVEIGPTRVSRHCGDPATLNVFDIAPSSVGDAAAQAAFVAAARSEEGARVSRFIPYPDDPGHHFEIRP